MATSLWQLLKNYKVVIPILQRDYAQGREIGKAPLIRERFLNVLCNSIKVKELLELDFVYGYTKEGTNASGSSTSSFIPLDGQQRLTTLFLLHWYIANKEGHIEDSKSVLIKFTYETRHSSRLFCEKLVEFSTTDIKTSITETIINQSWFFTAWKNDPTISAMLIMLDAIQKIISESGLNDVWPLLTSDEPLIVFHLLPMEKLGLPDDLYIKMNSRGKELTPFEHFKSRFSEIISNKNSEIFNLKIDQAWSDLFWDLHRDDEDSTDIAQEVDSSFMRFFSFVSDLLAARDGIIITDEIDEFVNYQKIYATDQNTEFLFSCLDDLYILYNNNPDFFSALFYVREDDFSENKVRLFFQNSDFDLFKKCSNCYDASIRNNQFSIGEQLLLYACLVHLQTKSKEFNIRVRIIRNLISNSEDIVRKENIQSLLKTVYEIVVTGLPDIDSKFNKTRVEEEKAKQIFIQTNVLFKKTLQKLEDHRLLQGCLTIFSLDEAIDEYATVFQKLFSTGCSYDNVSTALLTFGDYSQEYGLLRRLGNGNDSVWRELFTPSQSRKDFKQTRETLYALLSYCIKNIDSTLNVIVANYLDSNPQKDWIYYYIKYQSFRFWNTNQTAGFYFWKHQDRSLQYECIMMYKIQFNGRHWSPFLLALKDKNTSLRLEEYNAPLTAFKEGLSLNISNVNNGFKIEAIAEKGKAFLEKLRELKYVNSDDILEIVQSNNEIDLEDRIEKADAVIRKMFDL